MVQGTYMQWPKTLSLPIVPRAHLPSTGSAGHEYPNTDACEEVKAMNMMPIMHMIMMCLQQMGVMPPMNMPM